MTENTGFILTASEDIFIGQIVQIFGKGLNKARRARETSDLIGLAARNIKKGEDIVFDPISNTSDIVKRLFLKSAIDSAKQNRNLKE
jgi:hypothetical protein